MATKTQPKPTPQRTHSKNGWITFAASYLVIAGFMNAIWGITALANKDYFHEESLVFSGLNFWGWVAITVALVQGLTAYLILGRKMGGMIMALVVCMVSTLVNFMSIGAYPIWSSIAIGCNLLVLWAVTVHGEQDL